MSTDRVGFLNRSEREHVDKRLQLLNEEPIVDGDELLLISAVHRSLHSRDVLVMSSLGISVIALAVAVVVGSLATHEYVALLLIGYLVLARVLSTVTLIAIRQAVTAEAVRVIVARRVEQRDHRARAAADRSDDETARTPHKRLLLSGLLGLARACSDTLKTPEDAAPQ